MSNKFTLQSQITYKLGHSLAAYSPTSKFFFRVKQTPSPIRYRNYVLGIAPEVKHLFVGKPFTKVKSRCKQVSVDVIMHINTATFLWLDFLPI